MQGGKTVLARVARTGLGRFLFVGAAAFAVTLAPASGASADVLPPRPAFGSPFSCGQVWFARTYPGHPQFAVDWNLPGSSEADFGQPVFAGAPGVVTVTSNAGYGNFVTIDHGDGWATLYAHLSEVTVATGDRVTASTLVGRVGRTGRADASHLHQEQLFNLVRQPIVVDGHPVNATFSSRGASYESANCPTPARRLRSPWRPAVRTSPAPARPQPRLIRLISRPLP